MEPLHLREPKPVCSTIQIYYLPEVWTPKISAFKWPTMESGLAKLCSFYNHPAWGPVPAPEDWAVAEELVGRELPGDFKRLIEHTGGCPIGSNLHPRNPAVTTNDNIALNRGGMMKIYVGWKDIASLRDFCLFPDIGGYITIAQIDLTLLMLSPVGDDIFVADFGDFDPPVTSELSFTEFIWKAWGDRAAFDNLGSHIWRDGQHLFDHRMPFR